MLAVLELFYYFCSKQKFALMKRSKYLPWATITVSLVIANVMLFALHGYIKDIPFVPTIEVISFFGMFIAFGELVNKAVSKDIQERRESSEKKDSGYSYLGF